MRNQKYYSVEKILARRLNKKTGEYEYKIKWEGYDSDECTWEPYQSLQFCKELVKKFNKKLKQQLEDSKSVPQEESNEKLQKNLIQQIERESNEVVRPKYSKEKKLVSQDWRFFASKLITQEVILIESLVSGGKTKKQKELLNIRDELKHIQSKILQNKVEDLENLQALVFLTQINDDFTLIEKKKKSKKKKEEKKKEEKKILKEGQVKNDESSNDSDEDEKKSVEVVLEQEKNINETDKKSKKSKQEIPSIRKSIKKSNKKKDTDE